MPSNIVPIVPFQNNEADAVTLDGGQVFDAGQAPYNLKPIVSEVYNTDQGGKFEKPSPGLEFISSVSNVPSKLRSNG